MTRVPMQTEVWEALNKSNVAPIYVVSVPQSYIHNVFPLSYVVVDVQS